MVAREKPPENAIFQLVHGHPRTSTAIHAQCVGMATALANQFAQVPGEIERLYTNFNFSLDPPLKYPILFINEQCFFINNDLCLPIT